MLRLKRVQVHFHTHEGQVMTSTQLDFGAGKAEYVNVSTIAWLLCATTLSMKNFVRINQLITHEKSGCHWLHMKDVEYVLTHYHD